jgi:acetyl-CoA/propionyl-CoA carboxylase, biotin carboxylase, biotin carboxyl carrier protein
MPELKRVLVANRGEIALRIVRAAHDASMTAVAVYAEEDAGALYARAADDAVRLDGPGGVRAYLNIPALLAAADRSGADAVHPGYGFLAERAEFARAVTDAGLTWIGPPPEVIDALGDKIRAREIAARAGAPMVPGSTGTVADPAEAVAFAVRHGLPIAIKAAYGGGGRGLRIAGEMDQVAELFEAAAREASAAFGRGDCFVEAYVERARHVEAQIIADQHGTVLVAGTRDCTLQRRYQKLVEEAPAPFLTDEQRERLELSAAAICREAGYVSAGTVEFLLSPQGQLSFLEVNTRLQVEHTVTEETSGLDLVRAQFRVAAGQRLTAGTDDGLRPSRHAIEFRVNAEDPDRDFAPSTGTIAVFRPPGGPGVRLDTGVTAGDVVSGQFDSLLAKLIVTGRDRDEALQRARRALDEFKIEGVRTTLPFLRAVIDEPDFTAAGPAGFAVHTRWIARDYLPAAAARTNGPAADSDDLVAIQVGGRWLSVRVPGLADRAGPAGAQATEGGPLARAREQATRRQERVEQAGDGLVAAPMQGTVVLVAVAEGEEVTEGQLLAVVEAMKMENPLRSPHAGRVEGLRASVGQTVAQGAMLCRVIPAVLALAALPDRLDQRLVAVEQVEGDEGGGLAGACR